MPLYQLLNLDLKKLKRLKLNKKKPPIGGFFYGYYVLTLNPLIATEYSFVIFVIINKQYGRFLNQ